MKIDIGPYVSMVGKFFDDAYNEGYLWYLLVLIVVIFILVMIK